MERFTPEITDPDRSRALRGGDLSLRPGSERRRDLVSPERSKVQVIREDKRKLETNQRRERREERRTEQNRRGGEEKRREEKGREEKEEKRREEKRGDLTQRVDSGTKLGRHGGELTKQELLGVVKEADGLNVLLSPLSPVSRNRKLVRLVKELSSFISPEVHQCEA